MKWKLPKIDNEKFYFSKDKGSAIIIPENGEDIKEIAVEIASIAIQQAEAPGIGALTAILSAIENKTLNSVTEEDKDFLRKEAEKGKIHIDYWRGRCVKLTLFLKDDEIEVSLYAWLDRLAKGSDDWDTVLDKDVIEDFEGVLKLVKEKFQ